MAPMLVGGSWVPAATLACGLVTPSLVVLFLLCSFCHRDNWSFSTQTRKRSSGLVRGVKLARLSSRDRRAALRRGTPSPGEHQQQADGPIEPGNPEMHVPGLTPHSQPPSGPIPKTPEFLQHRQLPVVPGYSGTPTADPVPAGEGTIYESIRYKSGSRKKPRDAGSTPGDAPSLPPGDTPSLPPGDTPSLPAGDKLSIPMSPEDTVPEEMSQEEAGSEGNPGPVYAQVCKPPRALQPWHPISTPESQEGEEETPPPLPEKCFDVA